MKKIGIAIGCAMLTFGLTGCGGYEQPTATASATTTATAKAKAAKKDSAAAAAVNTDPRIDWVYLKEPPNVGRSDSYFRMKCEETILIFERYWRVHESIELELLSVKDAPQCQPD